ncbi:MAG: DUF952 domain-containing protein [Pseudomonadota bacterium]
MIYKIAPQALWREAERRGVFDGAPIDLQDGFIHFSTAAQAAETAAKHFAGQSDLLLIAVEAEPLGDALRWEPSRGGALFPHLYRALQIAEVAWVSPLPLGEDGAHRFPEMT